jgi:hypothetical protein
MFGRAVLPHRLIYLASHKENLFPLWDKLGRFNSAQ